MVEIDNREPIYANDFRGLDFLQRGADDVPSFVSGGKPDALDITNAVERVDFVVLICLKFGPAGYVVNHVYP